MLHQWDLVEVAVLQMEDSAAGDIDCHNLATFGERTSTSSYYEAIYVMTGSCQVVICL